MYTDEQLAAGFRVGEWTILPARSAVIRGDEERIPEPLVFSLLMELARHDGELVSKDALIETIWDNRAMSDAPVNRAITQLRKLLDDTSRPYRFIENVSKRGYRLKTPVQPGVADAPPVERAVEEDPGRRWRGPVVAAVLLLAAAVVWLVWPDATPTPDDARVIVVLPFDDLSPEAGNRYLVDAFKEELINSLYTVPGISVVNSRRAYSDAAIADIAADYGADSVLEGSVQRIGERLKIFYRITESDSGMLLFSGSLEGELESHFALQTQLANTVRQALLGDAGQTLITREKPKNFAAYDNYMRGLFALDARQTSTSLDDAIHLFQETIRIDPDFGPAYIMLATAYSLLPTYRDVKIDEASRLALDAVERGLAVDPSIEDTAAAIRGLHFHRHMQWAEAEAAFQQAVSASVVDPTAFNWYSRMLASVGRLDESRDFALKAVRLDPTSAVLNSRAAMSHAWLGEYERAVKYFERAEELGAGGKTHEMAYALSLFELGDRAGAYALTRSATGKEHEAWVALVFSALEDVTSRGAALLLLNSLEDDSELEPQVELIVRAMLNDTDGALAIANRLIGAGEIFEMDLLFIPQTKSLREHEDFEALTDALGLRSYWNERNCQWQGHGFNCAAR